MSERGFLISGSPIDDNFTGTCLSSITVVYENSAMELQRGWAINYQGEKIDFFEAQRHEVNIKIFQHHSCSVIP